MLHRRVLIAKPLCVRALTHASEVWEWTDLVHRIHESEMEEVLGKMQPTEAAVFLRQGFRVPRPKHQSLKP